MPPSRPRASAANTEPWRKGRIRIGTTIVVEVVPTRVAVRWSDSKRDRLHEAVSGLLGTRGSSRTLETERLFILTLAGRVGPGWWDRLAELQRQGLVEWATPLLRDVESGLLRIVTGEIVVRLRGQSATLDGVRRMAAPLGLRAGERNEFVENQFVLKIPRFLGLQVVEKAAALAKMPGVEFAAPSFLTEIAK